MEFNKKKYLKSSGTLCPYCDSTDLEAGPFEFPAMNAIVQDITCNNCKKEWIDKFILTDAYLKD